MGANNILPSVPTFTAGAPSIAQLNALSYAVSFLVDDDVRPIWKVFLFNGTQALTASVWNNVTFDHVAIDSDGVSTGAGTKSVPAIVTQGIYDLEACVQLEAVAGTGQMFTTAFLFTAGANNPHFAPNATQYFGYGASRISSTAQAAADNAMCIASTTPMVCYPGDKLNVAIFPSAAYTLDFNENPNTSYIQGRLATLFTGMWSHVGS